MSIQISHNQKTGHWSFSYNRHIFVVVGMAFILGGIAAMAGPWWLPLATFVSGKVDIKIDSSVNYWVGAILIAIGLAILAFKHFRMDKLAGRIAIDKGTIAQSPPVVEDVRRYFDSLLDDHSYRSSADTAFYVAHNQFMDSSKAIQDIRTANLYEAFSENAKALHAFVHENFYVFPDNQGANPDYKYCLEPDLNIERNMLIYDKKKVERYNALKHELSERTGQAKKSYAAFVARLKQLGHI